MSETTPSEPAVRIRQLREERGWNQTEFARRLGKTQSEVNRWESGRVRPGYDTLVLIARTLGVAPGALTGEEPDDEVHDFIAHALQTVRRVQGATPAASEEEVRAIKRDVLAGMIRLARAQGMDAARLEEELAKLGGHGAVQVRGESVAERMLAIADRDSQAALERAVALKHFGVAAQIDAEEGKVRREKVGGLDDAERDRQLRAIQAFREAEEKERREQERREAGGAA